MELGTSIFLSSITVAVVLLYGFTKDRWPWRRIVFRSLAGVLTLMVIGAALIFATWYWDQIFPVKLGRQTEYAGLRLGMSRDEVRYVKGMPPSVVTKDFDVLKSSELPNGRTINDYPLWVYEGHEHYIHAAFGVGVTVRSIACVSLDMIYRCPPIGDAQDGRSEAELLHSLGAPSKSEIKDATKSLEYNDLGIEFKLKKEKVYRLLVGQIPLL